MSNDYWRYVILFPVKLTEFSLLIYFYAVTAKDIFTQRADKQLLRVYNIHKHKRNTTNYAFIHAWKMCNGQIVKSRHKRWSFRRDRESWSIRRIYISHLWQTAKMFHVFTTGKRLHWKVNKNKKWRTKSKPTQQHHRKCKATCFFLRVLIFSSRDGKNKSMVRFSNTQVFLFVTEQWPVEE